jgi:hypothetical protein
LEEEFHFDFEEGLRRVRKTVPTKLVMLRLFSLEGILRK